MSRYCKILVVDDEIITRRGIRHLVNWESEGFQIVGETSNGEEALEQVRALRPDIVISDIVMPVMDGLSLTQVLHEKHPEIQVVILSGYSEFEYVKSTFQNGAADYILKPTLNPQNLLDTLKKAAAKIPDMLLTSNRELSIENMLNQAITGFEPDGGGKKLRRAFPFPGFLLLGINIPYVFGEARVSLPRQRKVLEEKASAYLNGLTYHVVAVDDRLLTMVLNFEEEEYRGLVKKIRAMVDSMDTDGQPLFYVYSEPFSSLDQIKSVFHNHFVKYTEQQFYYRQKKILCVNEIGLAEQAEKFDMKTYGGMIKGLQWKEAIGFLSAFCERVVASRSLSEIELKATTQNALYTFLSKLEDLGFDSESLQHIKRECFIKISEAKYAGAFLETLHKILANLETLTEKYRMNAGDGTMQRITEYIAQNYAQALTLNDLAKRFNFNYYYLSSYFSERNREGFSEYLNQVRIEKATELLRDAAMPISRVSEAVGYSDQSYFSKVFKKFTGCIPSDYRKKYLMRARGDGSGAGYSEKDR